MIAPLRVQLVESKTLVERHEKLASLGMLAAGRSARDRNPLTAIKAALLSSRNIAPVRLNAGQRTCSNEIMRLERIVTISCVRSPSDPEFATLRRPNIAGRTADLCRADRKSRHPPRARGNRGTGACKLTLRKSNKF